MGPTPAKPGQAIGSAGPTTSYRMDAYSPILIEQGLIGMIGKGKRGTEVIAIVVIDSKGNNLYESGRASYLARQD